MFCMHCGRELDENGNCICEESKKATKKVAMKLPGKEKMNPKLLITIVAVVVFAVVAGILLSTSTPTLELGTYLDADPYISGLNGKATISTGSLFNDADLEQDLMKLISSDKDVDRLSDKEMELMFTESMSNLMLIDEVLDTVIFTLEKNGQEVDELTNLSNGDVIKVKASVPSANIKELNVRLESGEIEFTIKGLMDAKEVAVFENAKLEVTFAGMNGSGKVLLGYISDAMPDLRVEFEVVNNTYAYSNGDVVEVALRYNQSDWETKGYVPKETSRTYTVEGLGEALTSSDELSEDIWELMKTRVENELKSQAEEDWYDGVSITNLNYLGNYVLTRKDGASGFGPDNLIYLVYQVEAFENFALTGGEDHRVTYYYYGLYEGVTVGGDGSVNVDSLTLSGPWHSIWRDANTNGTWIGIVTLTYDGYETLDELYEECVTDYADQYNCESTVVDVPVADNEDALLDEPDEEGTETIPETPEEPSASATDSTTQSEPADETTEVAQGQSDVCAEYVWVFENTERAGWEVVWETIKNYDPQVHSVLTDVEFATLEAYVMAGINEFKNGNQGTTSIGSDVTGVDGSWNKDMALEAFNLQNQRRADAGQPALIWSDTLYKACEIRTKEIASSFSHTRPDGSSYATALVEAGYGNNRYSCENIAYGQNSASQVVQEWYDSDGHRENMLRAEVSDGAIGCYSVDGVYYWVAISGR